MIKDYWFKDEYGMVLIQNHGNGQVWENGHHDSIGRTYIAYMAYRDPEMLEGLLKCITWDKGKLILQRHPEEYELRQPISRDHVKYWFSAMLHSSYAHMIPFWAKHLKMSSIFKYPGFIMTLELKLWLMLLSNNPIGYLYYPVTLWEAFLNNKWNKFWNKLLPLGEEVDTTEFVNLNITKYNRPKGLNRIVSVRYPVFGMKFTLTQLLQVSDNWYTDKIRKLYSEIIPKKNYVLQELCYNLTDESVIDNYKSTTGDRWDLALIPLMCANHIEIVEQNDFNVDKQYLIHLHDEIKARLNN